MADVTIEARPNGPYVVTGTVELRDTTGTVLPTQARTVLWRINEETILRWHPFENWLSGCGASGTGLGGRWDQFRYWGDSSERHRGARRGAGRYRICRCYLWCRSGRRRKVGSQGHE
jgi:hypothetical protein